MSIISLENPFHSLVEKRKELDALLREVGIEQIKPIFAEFFKRHPNVDSVRWTQYTPYFNDGDECIFSVHELNYKTADSDPDGGDYGNGWYDRPYGSTPQGYNKDDPWWGFDQSTRDDFLELQSFIQGNEDAMRIAFGDHVEVIVNKDDIKVNDCHHD